MIYLTGDCHGSFTKFSKTSQKKGNYVIEDNSYVIVTGDFGLLWAKDKEFEYNLKWLSQLKYKILWVQGNHENYNMISEYPLSKWNGGLVRFISGNVILLERGQVFSIEGKKFFTFGGAKSTDVAGGILDSASPTYEKDKAELKKSGILYRVRDISWWAQELPSDEEMQEGIRNLDSVGWEVDYVITHCLSSRVVPNLSELGKNVRFDILTDYLSILDAKLKFKHWFCGHYHLDKDLDEKHHILYNSIVPLDSYH